MASPAQYSTTWTSAYDTRDGSRDFADGELFAGDRIGPLPGRSRGKAMRRGLAVMLLAGGSGWAYFGDHADWSEWLPAVTSALSPAWNRAPPVPPQSGPTAGATQAAASEPAGTVAEMPPTDVAADLAANAESPAETPAAPEASAETMPAEPLPPPEVDPGDALQKRALAAGLHPGLSRVLLQRLSAADYRNATVAIKTALAETADTEVLSWPREPKPAMALFKVRFVAGAFTGCRRYVVTVTKDGWLTTALPMEKCHLTENKTGKAAAPPR